MVRVRLLVSRSVSGTHGEPTGRETDSRGKERPTNRGFTVPVCKRTVGPWSCPE